MKPRLAIRHVLLFGGIGFGLLALLLLLPSWLNPQSAQVLPSVSFLVNPTPVSVPGDEITTPSEPQLPTGEGPWDGTPLPTRWSHPDLPIPFPTTGLEGTLIPVTPPAANLTQIAALVGFQADYGAWHCTVWNFDGGWGDLAAEVRYDTTSAESIQAYAAANRALVDQLRNAPQPVRVDVTFRDYLAPDAFRAWVQQSGIRPAYTSLRTLDQQGGRANLVVEATWRDPIPQAAIDQRIADAQARGHPITVLGVIYVTAEIEAAPLAALNNDPLVFLADVTPNIVIRDLRAAHPAVGFPSPYWVRITPESPFLRMEDLGLEHFR